MPEAYKIGIGGAPTRASTMPHTAEERKKYPVASGLMDYFPDALLAVAHLSFIANEQHNPGQPLHWARGKSMDDADAMLRHFLERGSRDTDGIRHSTKVAWRSLATLQKEIEADCGTLCLTPECPCSGANEDHSRDIARMEAEGGPAN
jgi:hypothetical protein